MPKIEKKTNASEKKGSHTIRNFCLKEQLKSKRSVLRVSRSSHHPVVLLGQAAVSSYGKHDATLPSVWINTTPFSTLVSNITTYLDALSSLVVNGIVRNVKQD